MNIYTYFILFFVIAEFIINLISERLNIKHSKFAIPVELEDIYSKEKYGTSRNYMKEKSDFSIISSFFGLVFILIIWFSGFFESLNIFVEAINDNIIIKGLIYIGILTIISNVINIPFSVYSTFGIEKKYGFNTITIKIYILDLLKKLLITILLGAPILSLILWVLIYFEQNAFLFGWIISIIISIILSYLAPQILMPLFNKFKPIEDGKLKDEIFAFAQKVNYPLKKVFVMDGSKRSLKSNAFFTGIGNNKRIVLYDTLINNHSIEELVAILAHEIGHYKKKHVLQGMILSFIHTGIIFWLLSIFINNVSLYQAFFMTTTPLYAGLFFFGMLLKPIEIFLGPVFNMISRANERAADKYAADNYDVNHLKSALKKLSVDNLSNLTPHPFYVFLNYSHPPLIDRLKSLY